MVLDEADQRVWKRRLVIEALERIGRLREVEVAETAPSGRDLGYRNKIELAFGRDRGARALGFHPSGAGGRVVDVERCLLQGDAGGRVLASAREFFLRGPGRSEPALEGGEEPLRLVVRESGATGEVLVALRGAPGPFRTALPFAKHLVSRHPEVAGVVRLLASPGRRGGARTETLAGRPWIEEAVAGVRFRLPAAAFFQVNSGAAGRLVREVIGAAGRSAASSEVLDLYGGAGLFAIALARAGWRATVVEADRDAVDCGRRAVSDLGLGVVSFVVSGVAGYLRRRGTATGGRLLPPAPDLVVADPPRTGLGPGVADAISRLRPQRIVLVSCDAPTLARDLRALADRGYALRRVVPVDLFPQTAAIEAVAVLDR
jgi:23S rRNA (uracil-5-)-methyltransferase RumA